MRKIMADVMMADIKIMTAIKAIVAIKIVIAVLPAIAEAARPFRL